MINHLNDNLWQRVTRLRGRGRRDTVGPIVAFSLLAIAASIVIVAMFAIAVRSGRDVVGDFLPGWPWW